MKRRPSFICALAALLIPALFSGCETPQQNAALDAALVGTAPYATTPRGAESLNAMGNVASRYANAQASSSRITVNNSVPPPQEQPQQVPSGPNVGDIKYVTEEVMRDGGKYAGLLKFDLDGMWHPEEQGTYTWRDGNKYEGEFRDGERNGQGTETWPNGEKYVGEFHDGKINGPGTNTFPDGRKFEGEFRDGQPNGHGTYTFADCVNGTAAVWSGIQPTNCARYRVLCKNSYG